jgi:hypothetical protein
MNSSTSIRTEVIVCPQNKFNEDTKMSVKSVDEKINSLQPGERVEISKCVNTRCIAERSGDGRTIRFIRETPDEFTVYHSEKF